MPTPEEIAQRTAIRDRFVALDALQWGETPQADQQRGRQFERLVQDLFDAHGMLVRCSNHTEDGRSEQILLCLPSYRPSVARRKRIELFKIGFGDRSMHQRPP